jgi:hypothetical protein
MYDTNAASDDAWILWFTFAMAVWGAVWIVAYVYDWCETRKLSKRLMNMLARKRR